MAVHWAPEAGVQRTGASGYSVLPENVVILHDLSGRMDETDVTDLSRDIEVNGQLEPAVCWKNKSGFPVLAAGHRRFRAVSLINKTRIPENYLRLFFNYIPAETEQEAFDYTIRENRNRINPSLLDDAHNMQIYQIKWGLGEEAIARKYYPGMQTPEELEKAVREVKQTLALLELSDEAKDEFRKGFFKTSAAIQLAAIPSKKQQNEAIQKAKDEGQKVLKTEDAKAARAAASGKPSKPAKSISENSPVALLKKYKEIASYASSLAGETLSEEPNVDSLMSLSRAIVVLINDVDINLLPPGFHKKVEEYRSEEKMEPVGA